LPKLYKHRIVLGMADYIKNFDNDDEKYITGLAVQPQKFNILLTRDGDEIDFLQRQS
jgi:hypothetical protein